MPRTSRSPQKVSSPPAKRTAHKVVSASPAAVTEQLLGDIRQLIEQARTAVAQTVNAGLVLLNWHIGQRIRTEILGEERAEYGEEIVSTLSRQLAFEIVATLSQQCRRTMQADLPLSPSALRRDFACRMNCLRTAETIELGYRIQHLASSAPAEPDIYSPCVKDTAKLQRSDTDRCRSAGAWQSASPEAINVQAVRGVAPHQSVDGR